MSAITREGPRTVFQVQRDGTICTDDMDAAIDVARRIRGAWTAAESERVSLRAEVAALKQVLGFVMSTEDGLRALGLDVERARKAEAEIAAGNSVAWEDLRAELLAKSAALLKQAEPKP